MAQLGISTPTASHDEQTAPAPPASWLKWTGLAVTALPALMLAMSATMKLSHSPQMAGMMVSKFGYPEHLLPVIGTLEVLCLALYLIPRTATLGAILLTGYLGGAVATHVRVGDAFVAPLLVGVLVWLGLYLRDTRLRPLLPLRAPRG
jgi:hypothetical protein